MIQNKVIEVVFSFYREKFCIKAMRNHEEKTSLISVAPMMKDYTLNIIRCISDKQSSSVLRSVKNHHLVTPQATYL